VTRAAGRTVLVVDDDPEAREVVAEHLALHGFTVVEATSGPEALMELARARPEAVVLDLDMPRLGGLEALRRLRALDPAVTVVLVTEDVEDEVYWRAIELGAHGVLAKPIVLADLEEALEAENPMAGAVAGAPPPAAPREVPAVGPGRVLVIEPDREVRSALERFIALRGHRVTSLADDRRAERALMEASPDVVVLDITSAGAEGLPALPTIRALAPEAMVILIGGVAEHAIARRALARGAFDWIVKPVDLDQLGRSLDMALLMKRLATGT
jgi:DNA-binding NtrC family response regulator